MSWSGNAGYLKRFLRLMWKIGVKQLINYKCPECEEYGNTQLWDYETLSHYDKSEYDYVLSIGNDDITHCEFYCPNCKSLINGKNIKTDERFEEELVEYFVVNSELNMSVGKTCAQVGHTATIIAVERSNSENEDFDKWYENDQKKIILRGKQKDLEKLIDAGFYYIRDNGLTEVPFGSLTVVGLPPMPKSEAHKYVKRLQLL
jgi:PTH2 family peptidyl-tRNA hydrolase